MMLNEAPLLYINGQPAPSEVYEWHMYYDCTTKMHIVDLRMPSLPSVLDNIKETIDVPSLDYIMRNWK